MLLRLRRTAVVLASVAAAAAGVGVLPAAQAARTTPVAFPASPHGMPAPVALPREVDAPSPYAGQVSCNPVLMPGVRRFRTLALRAYDGIGGLGGVTRDCTTGGQSEHKEGRAWDWMLSYSDRAQRRAAADFLAWLTKPGPDGEAGLNARRLGVMYVIYNRRMWRAYDPDRGWTSYTGSDPHTSHVHISFGWAGARGRTSFWTGRVARPDYGPCSVFARQPARISVRTNPRPCEAPAALVKRSARRTAQFGASDNRAVRAAQRRLGIAVTGDFTGRTWRAVKRYQRAHDLPVTGVLDKPTWASLDPGSVRWSALEGFRPVRAARYAARHFSDVTLRRGSAGRDVAFLQTALRLPRADRNGLLARHTAAAVRAFKTRHGFAANAAVNADVWRAIAKAA